MATKANGDVVVETPVTEAPATINLKRIERRSIEVPVIGTAPLIVHRFDEKAKQMMLEAQQTKTRTKKAPKDPHADYMRSMYRFADGAHGFPAVGFKAAMVDSARLYEGVKMTELRACIHVLGEGPDQLVHLNFDVDPSLSAFDPAKPNDPLPRMREDAVRIAMGTADLRYRAEYWPWSATLTVQFVPSMISTDSVVALVDAAGLGGIGEWRPSKAKTGIFGTFQVAV